VTVTAAEPDQPTPTGIVVFKEGQTVLGSGTLDANGRAFFETAALGTGYHPITAVYQGDLNFTGSTSPVVNQLINQDPTTPTKLTASANPGIVGQPITLTVTVGAAAPGSGVPTGMVVFQDGTMVLGSAALTTPISSTATPSSATASFSTTLAMGEHDLFALYLGDGNFLPTAGFVPLTEVVNNPAPILDSISPTSVPEGHSGFTLTLNGSNFVSGASVSWNGSPLAIVSLSSTQIQVQVPKTLLGVVGTASVTVLNPGAGGGLSLARTFTITDAPLTAYSFTLNVTGNHKYSGPVATFTDPALGATPFKFGSSFTWDKGTVPQGNVSPGHVPRP